MFGDMTTGKLDFVLCLLGATLLAGNASSRVAADADQKERGGNKATVSVAHCIAGHRIGAMELAVNNNGTIGTGFRVASPATDFFTGESVLSCEYPRGSNVQYLFAGAFWIGAVVDRDTLVSVGADGWSYTRELYPDAPPFGNMIKRSITHPNSPLYDGAVSEEDYISVYTDTITQDVPADFFGRPHIPLNIEITDASYAWSYSYAEDLVLFDYQIRNIGVRELTEVYMGVYVDADVYFGSDDEGHADDLCGFLHTYPAQFGSCVFNDTVNIAWIADNDGDLDTENPAEHVTATRIVRTPAEEMEVSFNWWISNGNASMDFGPRRKNVEHFRDLGTGGLGTPEGDVNKYDFMSNREFDYDQEFVASIQPTDTLWLFPGGDAAKFATGFDTRYLLSFGPFTIRPGQTLPVSLAYVGGMDLHTDAGNFGNLPNDPQTFWDNLDFSDLATNATWAAWIYDNPGVDTDQDGFCGLYHICCSDSETVLDTFYDSTGNIDSITTGWNCTIADTFYYQGDGVPDFRGAAPPPAPDFWVEPSANKLRIRFNGLRSETTKDAFSRLHDFEGYRVYLGRDDRSTSFGVVASYDVEDYNKLTYDPTSNTPDGWALLDVPFTIDSLRCLYGDSCEDMNFDPLSYTRSSCFIHPNFPDSQFLFEAQDYNVSELGVDTPIRKTYPEQPYPSSLIPDSAQPNEVTDDGYLKYFEYETEIDNLLPTVAYWVNVTAFDYGSPESGLSSLETSVSVGARSAYPLAGWEEVEAKGLKAYVYPNPYRIDGDYRDRGLEGRVDSDRPIDRTRVLNFANLPPKCTIRIFTVDGDLVRELIHDKSLDDPKASHEEWNLITRNTQMVVSGFYYWTVEDEKGDVQIGKLAIIM